MRIQGERYISAVAHIRKYRKIRELLVRPFAFDCRSGGIANVDVDLALSVANILTGSYLDVCPC